MIITLFELLTEIGLTAAAMASAGFIAGYCVAAKHFDPHKKGHP